MFLNIRGKSVGESIDVNVICPDDEKTSVKVEIDLDDIKVQKTEGHTNKIQLDKNLMMELKYPSLDEFIDSRNSVFSFLVQSAATHTSSSLYILSIHDAINLNDCSIAF